MELINVKLQTLNLESWPRSAHWSTKRSSVKTATVSTRDKGRATNFFGLHDLLNGLTCPENGTNTDEMGTRRRKKAKSTYTKYSQYQVTHRLVWHDVTLMWQNVGKTSGRYRKEGRVRWGLPRSAFWMKFLFLLGFQRSSSHHLTEKKV